MLRQTEEDTDQEILQLKNNYEWQLRRRQEECTKMKGELGLQNKKVHTHTHPPSPLSLTSFLIYIHLSSCLISSIHTIRLWTIIQEEVYSI